MVCSDTPRTVDWRIFEYTVTLPHPPKCCSLLAGVHCPRAAHHSTAWCKWRALCKWSNIFATSVLGSHATFFFHPSDSYFPSRHCLKHILFNNSRKYIHFILNLLSFNDSTFHLCKTASWVSCSISYFPPIVTVTTCKTKLWNVFQIFSSLIISVCICSPRLFLPSFNSSPNFTSWPCSRAPSPSHIATRASRVGGQIDREHVTAVAFIATHTHWLSLHSFSWDGCLCTDWLSWADHSKRCKSLFLLFVSFPVQICFHKGFSSSAHWLHHWPSGRKDQRDPSDVRGSDQDCQPCGGLDWQTGHHHWLPC